jgi:hypothetical protein
MTALPPIELPQRAAPSLDAGVGRVRFIGTATVLVEYAGFTILTDPNFLHQGEHARLGYGLRSRRPWSCRPDPRPALRSRCGSRPTPDGLPTARTRQRRDAPRRRRAGHDTCTTPIMPLSSWLRMWQWNTY